MYIISPHSIKDHDNHKIIYTYIKGIDDNIKCKYAMKYGYIYLIRIVIIVTDIVTRSVGTYEDKINIITNNGKIFIDSSISMIVRCQCFENMCSGGVSFDAGRNHFYINMNGKQHLNWTVKVTMEKFSV